tara:strand:+ start:2366 stop:3061 length:696 start_codon:yes stop_codon:yes gene_type:complete
MDTVSVIIPTYNRFKYLLNTLSSIKKQTYENIEIIVIDDGSDEEAYNTYDWEKENIKIIHLPTNSKCVGPARNIGVESAVGKYIAFCDDDDIWFPEKIDLQLQAIKKYDCKMASTEGFIGMGMYDPSKTYKKYISEAFRGNYIKKYKSHGIDLSETIPTIWNLELIGIHNLFITSSIIVEKDLYTKVGGMPSNRRGQDYMCWLKILKHTDSVFIPDVCVYYDNKHGDGKNH